MKSFFLLFPAFAALILTAAPAEIITAVEPAGMSVKFSGKISSGDDVPAGKKRLLIHPTGGHVSTQLDRVFLRNMLDRLAEHLLEQ